ncbi:MAG: hypothetical protein FJX76_22170 [Armatimonadetes bacterium]|nr:hypothetical protein [Armatimonadota bacterium]
MALAVAARPAVAQTADWYLFSPRVDVAVFLGSALFSLALVLVGAPLGLLDAHAPEWTWIAGVLLVDVAHVWSTIFATYLDPEALRRHPARYVAVPLGGFLVGCALYGAGPSVFWRALAYLAVFHFVRQQYGWVMRYRARMGEQTGRAFDGAVIYACTLYPLLYWHAHLPRGFHWFLEGDFTTARWAAAILPFATWIYWGLLAAYAVRAALAWTRGAGNPGKDVIVATTAVCWYVGIVALNSDYAFTVTNVFIHGVPYLALLYWRGRDRGFALFKHGPLPYLAILWTLAFAEELLWDRGVWHDRAWLFGSGWEVSPGWLVPLLALPQLTHYVLDGFIWRRGD